MRPFKVLTACSAIQIAAVSSGGGAMALLYDNSIQAQEDTGYSGLFSDTDPNPSTTAYITADDVKFLAPVHLDRIEWSGLYYKSSSLALTPASDDFSIRFYTDNNGKPAGPTGIALFLPGNNVNRTATAMDASGSPVFAYGADIDLTLNSNQTYWLSISNRSTGTTADYYWLGQTFTGNNAVSSTTQGTTWGSGAGSWVDFRVYGTVVPEPGSLVLVAVAGTLFASRRKRNS